MLALTPAARTPVAMTTYLYCGLWISAGVRYGSSVILSDTTDIRKYMTHLMTATDSHTYGISRRWNFQLGIVLHYSAV